MKKITLLSLLFLVFISSSYAQDGKKKRTPLQGIHPENINPENGLIRCATTEYEELLHKQDPKRMTKEEFDAFLAPFIEQYKNTPANASQSGGIVYIPVVVHVIHNGDSYGTNENIADEQVQSQITVMTQDYRRMSGTPGFNSNAVGADVQIEFVLAKVDPNGNPTNGIDRVNLCRDNYNAGSFSAIQALVDSEVKPQTIWDPTQYMNMWSVNWDGSGLLGYAQFPSTGTTTANTDGVVAGHSYFGSRTLYPSGNYGDTTYDKGRTMTHEVGHFLGLYHTFQGGCTGAGDNCADTPSVDAANYGCPTGHDSCTAGSPDMIENYMDYTDDSCMNIFTVNQKAIVTSVMNTMPRRSSLKTSVKDVAIPLFANDAEVKIENYCTAASSPCTPANQHKVLLYNRGTSNLTSATINYNVDGGTNTPINWTGTLATNKYAEITFSTIASTGTLNVSVATVNASADSRATNNTASKAFSFTAATPPTNYDFTSFTFNLVGDRYGSETTWNLKNSSGTTLYSGGPYSDIATNTTQILVSNQVWNLPANGCYTFTINDTYGDGINTTYGAGNYTIKTNSGATTVASGGSFTSSEAKYFSNTSLSTPSFDSFNDVYVYPNPTKSTFNIAIPNGVELPNSLYIYNNIGQLIESKKVSSIDDLTINSSSYSVGVYFITIENNDNKKTLQLIKE